MYTLSSVDILTRKSFLWYPCGNSAACHSPRRTGRTSFLKLPCKEIPMRSTMTSSRAAWVAAGLLAGLAVANVCPHEPAYANTADRDSQFMMITVPVGNMALGLNDPLDGVFILDFVTGQLKGAVLNRQAGK